MHPDKFGDSYDIVKRSLLQWLSPCGTWAVHPMFSDPAPVGFAEEFSAFLGVPLVTTEPVPSRWERASYFEGAAEWSSTDHLFLDPDTGLAMQGSKSGREHIETGELVNIVHERHGKLVLVFDQAFSYNSDRLQKTREKLAWLKERGVYSLVYYSHANFVLASSDKEVLRKARFTLESESRLPRERLVSYRVDV